MIRYVSRRAQRWVVGQTAAAGTVLALGSSVTITVAVETGPDPVTLHTERVVVIDGIVHLTYRVDGLTRASGGSAS